MVVRMLLVNTDCNGGGNSEAHLTSERSGLRITGPARISVIAEKITLNPFLKIVVG